MEHSNISDACVFLALLQQLQERSEDQDDRECLKQAITALLNLQSSVERIYAKHQPRRKPGYASCTGVYNNSYSFGHSVYMLLTKWQKCVLNVLYNSCITNLLARKNVQVPRCCIYLFSCDISAVYCLSYALSSSFF